MERRAYFEVFPNKGGTFFHEMGTKTPKKKTKTQNTKQATKIQHGGTTPCSVLSGFFL